MVHLDRIKRTKLRAKPAIHADIDVDEEFGSFWNRLAVGIFPLDNPDALRRTNLCADAARGATFGFSLPWLIFLPIKDQNRQNPKPFLDRKALLGIRDCKNSLKVAAEEMPSGNGQPPQ